MQYKFPFISVIYSSQTVPIRGLVKMGRVILTCFSMRGDPPSSQLLPPEFDESLRLLLIGIQQLEASLPDHSLSLQWCTGATNLLKKMHLHMLTFVELSSAKPFEIGGHEVECYIDDYMRESLNLLDFCNLLKSVISGINRYRLLIDFAAERLGQDPSLTDSTIAEIQTLEADTMRQLQRIRNWKGFDKQMCSTRKRCSCFICGIRGSMRVICMIIVCTMLYPFPITNDQINGELLEYFPQLNLLSSSLNKLVVCFCKGLEERSVQGLVEKRMVEKAIREIKEGASTRDHGVDAEKIMMGVDLLRKKAAQLSQGLEMFQSEVSEVFEDVIKGRNKLLGRVKATYWK